MVQSNNYRVDSVGVYKSIWFCWRVNGLMAWEKKGWTTILDIIMHLLVHIWFPVHVTVGLLQLPMGAQFFRNLPMTIASIVCTLKHFCIRWKFRQITEMRDVFGELDERVESYEERKYFATFTMKTAKFMIKIYFAVYTISNIFGIISVFWDSERNLMYPAWFPFDWTSSTGLYYSALVYQTVTVTFLVNLNCFNDVFCSVTLCLLSGHVRLLAMRVARLGYDTSKTHKQHEYELKLCIQDHIKLLKLFDVVENSLSLVLLILFVSMGLCICVVVAYLVFYMENLASGIYYAVFLCGIAVELFPIFYFGSLLQEEFFNLPYAIFSSNWPSQTRSYRRSVVIFVEVALRSLTMLAGGFVGINLDSFFAIIKMAYSLFAVVLRIN